MTTNQTERMELLETYRSAGTELVTILLPTPSASGDAPERLRIRKKNVVSQMREQHAAEELLAATESVLESIDHEDAAARVLVVSSGGALLDRSLVRPVAKLTVRVGPVPMLVPLLGATQADRTHLAVILDRTGADVLLRHGVAAPLDEFEVDGPDVRVHRGHPGGWSQKRFQKTAENAWENNAKEVIDQISDEFSNIDLLIYGGDVRAAGFFAEHLPARFDAHLVDGSRHADRDAFLDAADVVLRDLSARSVVETLDSFRTANANGNAVSGSETLRLLMQGRVGTLLVCDDSDSPDRPVAAFDFEQNLFLPDAEEGNFSPMTDGGIALAVATGAEVIVVPRISEISDGIAGILRA